MAGYPKTPFHDPSAGLSDLSQLLAGGGYHPAAYKIGLAVTMVTYPALLALAGWLLGIRGWTLWISALLATIEYWTGFSRAMLDSGLYGFIWATAWVPLVLGLMVWWAERPTLGRWLALAGATAWTLFVHPTAVVMLAVPAGLLAAYLVFRLPIRQTGVLGLVAVVAALANLFWIVPMIRLWHLRQVQFTFLRFEGNPWLFLLQFYQGRPLEAVLVILGGIGILRLALTGRRASALALAAAMGTYFGLTFFGSLWEGTRGLEPLRFQISLHLVAALCAGEGIAWGCSVLGARSVHRLPVRILIGAVFLVVVVGLARANVPREVARAIVDHRPFPIGLTPEMTTLVEWIQKYADSSGRILFEDQLRLREATVAESLHWSCLLPVLTGREYIGGQYQVTPLIHHYASFGDFHLANRPIESYSPERLREFIDDYAIGWVIAWSPRSRAVLDRMPFLEVQATLPRHTARPTENRYRIYRVRDPSGYFALGSGRVVRREPNRIELADLVPVDGRIRLRYHWLFSLVTQPAVEIRRWNQGEDPVGFIELATDRPIPRLVIENGYSGHRARSLASGDPGF